MFGNKYGYSCKQFRNMAMLYLLPIWYGFFVDVLIDPVMD